VTEASPSRALSAAGALFFAEDGRIMLVQPTYKPGWEIPGGGIETGETPTEACVREVAEELGLEIQPGDLLVVDWAPSETDRILFVFDGGTLSPEELSAIRLDPAEIGGYEFVTAEEATNRLIPRLARRVSAALTARALGHPLYLEHGLPVTGPPGS
jgi:8-oxo-dGTP diphosphatase